MTAIKTALMPLLVAQAMLTRRRIARLPEAGGDREGEAGDADPASPLLRLLVIGDSAAAGVGVAHQRAAFAQPLAAQVAQTARTRVAWRLLARTGLNTRQALRWIEQSDAPPHDIAVVVTGVNDVVDQIHPRHAVAARDVLVNRLRNGHGALHVVFAPLPPVHQFPALPQPLRWVAGSDARRHDRALRDWVATRSDVSYVPIAVTLHRGLMADDGFHPGEAVYRHCAHAIAHHIATVLWPHLRPGNQPQ